MAPSLLASPTRFLFFTGKGGVGKTSVSAATAIALADAGRRVLLVSTDAASNLDEMLGVPFGEEPVPVPGVPGLSVLNIDPEAAAAAYRGRVLETVDLELRAKVEEDLSGACTTDIASFDAFAALLEQEAGARTWDHVVFDTAPTGHTLRLLSLPALWSRFLADNDRGASCLGPHSGLKMQEARFNAALAVLVDPAHTTVVLVARPEATAVSEAARTSDELRALGIANQRLVVNAVLRVTRPDDPMAVAIAGIEQGVIAGMPDVLRALPRDEIPLRPFDTVGLPALRAFFGEGELSPVTAAGPAPVAGSLGALTDTLAEMGHGLILVMGKGGVGKTTIAAAIAVGLVRRGHAVHLTTTDPAAHLASTLEGALEGMTVGRIDPKAETEAYIARMMATRGAKLDDAQRALMREDLESPCTEEVAVFHAFSRVVNQARSAFVVLDTAPTGHALLLIDATGAYHRQTVRGSGGVRLVTPLMRLQDPTLARVLVVTVPEPTPISQAAALEADLHRAGIEPWAWVVNKSLDAVEAVDPVLAARVSAQRRQLARVGARGGRLYRVPWAIPAPVGIEALEGLE